MLNPYDPSLQKLTYTWSIDAWGITFIHFVFTKKVKEWGWYKELELKGDLMETFFFQILEFI